MTRFTYLGIDETSLSIGNGGLIIVACESTNSSLVRSCGYQSLRKARDYLREAEAYTKGGDVCPDKIPEFPSLDEMRVCGLDHFHWMRASYGGRFKRQQIEHASIAHVVTSNGYNPQRTVLLIDAFHAKPYETVYLIREYLRLHGFLIPQQNIECHGQGDRSVPLINYADLLAFQIGLLLNKKYSQFEAASLKTVLEPTEIPFDQHRVKPLEEKGRKVLERILKAA